MATITSNPRRRLSKIPSAPTYASLASKYADTFQKAIDQQEAYDLETKMNLFRLGQTTYEDFKSYLEQKIKDAPAGTKKAADYTGLLVDAEKYNKQMIETNAKNTVEKMRTEMLEAIPGQVTTKNELDIVRKLKESVDKNSGVYADLVEQEAKLKNQLFNEGSSGGKSRLSDNLEKYYVAIATENKKLMEDYQAGKISGTELDTQLYNNGLNFQEAVAQAEASGVNVPASYLQVVEDTSYVEERLAQREVGQVFDVFNKNGQVETVSHQELLNDKFSANPKYTNSKYVVVPPTNAYDPYKLIDSETGKPVVDDNGMEVTASSATEARQLMEGLDGGETFSVKVPAKNANGLTTARQYNFDPTSQTFVPTDDPKAKTYAPVPGKENRFAPQSEGQSLFDFLQAGIAKINSFFDPTTNKLNMQSLLGELNPNTSANRTDQMGPFMEPTILDRQKDFVAPPEVQTAPVMEPKQNKGLFSKVKDAFSSKGVNPPVIDLPGKPSTVSGNLDLGETSFPKFNLSSVNVPDFNLGSFNAPTGFSLGGGPISSNMANAGPSFQPSSSTSLFDKVKSFGQSALGKVKSFLGF